VKFEQGKFTVVRKEMPDLDEAKRLWREGKSAQYILEQAQARRKAMKKQG
jgi:hypothetical protein